MAELDPDSPQRPGLDTGPPTGSPPGSTPDSSPEPATGAADAAQVVFASLAGWPAALELDALPWRVTRRPGVTLVPLHPPDLLERHEPVDAVCLIRMAPGCSYGSHRHLGPEEVLVLAGGYRDEFGEHRAGAFVRYDAGSVHRPVALGPAARAHDEGPPAESGPACVLLAVTHGGIAPVR